MNCCARFRCHAVAIINAIHVSYRLIPLTSLIGFGGHRFELCMFTDPSLPFLLISNLLVDFLVFLIMRKTLISRFSREEIVFLCRIQGVTSHSMIFESHVIRTICIKFMTISNLLVPFSLMVHYQHETYFA